MVNPPAPDADDGTGVEPNRGVPSSTPPKAPRWVKVSAIIVGGMILLMVIAMLTGLGGNHGPGRHSGALRPTVISGTDLRLPGGYPAEQRTWQSSYR